MREDWRCYGLLADLCDAISYLLAGRCSVFVPIPGIAGGLLLISTGAAIVRLISGYNGSLWLRSFWVPQAAERRALSGRYFWITYKSCLVHTLRPFITVTGSGKMDSETCKRLGYNFAKGFLQPPNWKSGFRTVDSLCWTISWQREGSEDKELLDLFSKHSHHQNITVLFLCQDMFPPGKYAKSISRNVHYIITFKNPRDQLAMRNLLLQVFPTFWPDIMTVYQKVAERPIGYLACTQPVMTGDGC